MDVFVVPMPTGTSNTEVVGNWHCQGTTATEANQGLQFFENTRQQQEQREQDPLDCFTTSFWILLRPILLCVTLV